MKKVSPLSLAVLILITASILSPHTHAQDTSTPVNKFELPEQYQSKSIPNTVDNRNKYMRTPFEHLGHPCAFSATISFAYTYNINRLRDLPSDNDDNLYPYTYGYHFYNDGSQYASTANILDGFDLLMATGVPTNSDMGGFTSGYPTKWPDGYDIYYKAMRGRVIEYDYFDCKTQAGIDELRQWIYDHNSGTDIGGVANFNVSSSSVKTKEIAAGPEAGKTLITAFGTGSYNHSLTVIGYHDDIQTDFNNDGRITNDADITGDGIVDIKDRETGAFLIINSHIYWDDGYAWVPYSLFSVSSNQGGIGRENKVYWIKVDENFEIKYTLKATITCESREDIKIYAGIAADENATQPTKTKSYAGAFNYAGGSYPMEGKNMKSTIEIGLDVTDLVDSIGGKVGLFFLCIDTRSGGSGTVNKLSLMDYSDGSGTPKKYPYKEENIAFSDDIKLGVSTSTVTVFNNSGTSYLNSNLLITPNPVTHSNKVSFSIPETDFRSAHIKLYDLNGKIVVQKHVSKSNAPSENLAIKSLAAGMYRVVVTVQKQNTIQKQYNSMITIIK